MKKNVALPSNRNFGLVFCILFLVVSLWPLLNNNEIRMWSLFISGIFLLLGLSNSKLLLPLNKLWFKFGILLGNIIGPIVMGIIFFFVVTPTGLIMRALGKDLLGLKNNTKKKSYWIVKNKIKSSLRNQF
tara:strand:+ start:319 stop:708 length:390 start_codon:yes stop_codon:yes gene_type:complete